MLVGIRGLGSVSPPGPTDGGKIVLTRWPAFVLAL